MVIEGDDMQPEELLKRLEMNDAPAVIDVRTGMEFRRGHIPGAIHAPTWKIVLGLARLPSDRSTEIVVTCALGPRARIAKKLLENFGYGNLSLLAGHMAGWRQAGLPLEK